MGIVLAYLRSRRVPAAAAALMPFALAACSSEALRFDNPNSNPYASRPHAAEVTGSTANPVRRVETAPIAAPPVAQSLPPPPAPAHQPASVPAQGNVAANVNAYQPTHAPRVAPADVTGGITPRTAAAPSRWDWDGGTAVTVRPGDTVETLSRKYGVPPAAIVTANNLGQPPVIYPGQRIVIPRFSATGRAVASTPAPAPAPANSTALRMPNAPARNVAPAPQTPARTSGHVHVVAPGETLHAIARRYNKRFSEITAANRLAPNTMVKVGDRIIVPGVAAGVAARTTQPAAQPQAVASPSGPDRQKQVASIEPPQNARIATPTAKVEDDKPDAEPAGGMPSFRWPVRGRVVTGFGAKINGQSNDGLNLAVPEGTAIRSAEDGVVAYAGNELKGYGNLILVRHSNGFVTAYAHASEIAVKRGDSVRRGQVIGKSGQTGNVTSPQLHFEIRKGSAPVDPAQYLPGA